MMKTLLTTAACATLTVANCRAEAPETTMPAERATAETALMKLETAFIGL